MENFSQAIDGNFRQENYFSMNNTLTDLYPSDKFSDIYGV